MFSRISTRALFFRCMSVVLVVTGVIGLFVSNRPSISHQFGLRCGSLDFQLLLRNATIKLLDVDAAPLVLLKSNRGQLTYGQKKSMSVMLKSSLTSLHDRWWHWVGHFGEIPAYHLNSLLGLPPTIPSALMRIFLNDQRQRAGDISLGQFLRSTEDLHRAVGGFSVADEHLDFVVSQSKRMFCFTPPHRTTF